MSSANSAPSTSRWWLEPHRAVMRTRRSPSAVTLDQIGQGLVDASHSSNAEAAQGILGVRIVGFPDRLPAAWQVDQYVRRNDLIATYERPYPDHLKVGIYWRMLTGAAISALPTSEWIGPAQDYAYAMAAAPSDSALHCDALSEGVHLIVSLQTDRLDGRPALSVVSRIPATQILFLGGADQETFCELSGELRLRPGIADSTSTDVNAAHVAPVWLVRGDEETPSLVLMTLPADLARVGVSRTGAIWQHEFHMLGDHLEKGVIRRAQAIAWWVPRESDEDWGRHLFGQWLAAPPPLTT